MASQRRRAASQPTTITLMSLKQMRRRNCFTLEVVMASWKSGPSLRTRALQSFNFMHPCKEAHNLDQSRRYAICPRQRAKVRPLLVDQQINRFESTALQTNLMVNRHLSKCYSLLTKITPQPQALTMLKWPTNHSKSIKTKAISSQTRKTHNCKNLTCSWANRM